MTTTAIPALLACMRAPGEVPSVVIRDGHGAVLELDDGREVIDAGSISASLLGHRHPALVEAVTRAAAMPYVTDGFGFGPRTDAAEDLLGIAFDGEDWAGVVRFVCSASEANDMALELAQIITERRPLVSRNLAYHGALGLARDASNHPLWNGGLARAAGGWQDPPSDRSIWRTLPEPTVDVGDLEDGETEPTLEAILGPLAGAAALITDHGSSGTLFPSAAYQDHLARHANEAGALWISDEAVTGLGRLGYPFAFQRGEARPDMVTLGKGLTGGAAPGGAVVLSRELVDRLGDRRWMTYSTFRGHPLTVAAISATVRTIRSEGLIERSREVGAEFGRQLRELAGAHPVVKRVAGEGLLWALELNGRREHASASWHGDGLATPMAEVVTSTALANGALMSAYSGLVVWLVPPLVIGEEQLSRVVEILDGALAVADEAWERDGTR
jgi:4-aminobutyrate aminotransferase-like enzyme